MDQYVNTITSLYDPHTNYFPPKDKKSFDIRMSGQLEGIGAQLREEDGYLKIAEIVPGAPAYKEGTLKAGFVIMKVAQGDKEPVDIFNMDQDDAIELIRGKKGTEVRLTVKNLQNEVQVISLIRDVLQLQDTFAKSALLENQGDKIGYIFLPQFYANFSNTTNGRSCSDDIKKEIQKLQSEGAQGIILDLRNNGGGSLNDVVSMSGFFFKEGPVVQVRSRGEKPTLLNDRDSKVLYEGQLIVMVNELSASASEILAAALQDYKRAVIVGSNSTYGKGTVQRFINMPQDLGAVKLTVQKFYRINGGATQLRGVNSDIVIPDEYSLLTLGERENESAMPWDEIPAAKYETWGKAPNIEKLRKKSYARISKNPTFELITEKAENNKNAREKTVYSLNMQGYQKEKAEKKEYEKKFTKISNEIPDMKPSLLEVDKILLKATPEDLTEREKWLVSLKKDPILFETVLIMKDMIQ